MTDPTNALSTANRSALPDAWIDRLFQRFAFMYGNNWGAKWAGLPMDQVKAAWAADLAFASADQLRRALDHCKSHNAHPPSSPGFVGLCRAFAPSMETGNRLPAPRGGEIDPKVRAEIAKFLNPDRKRDPKDWARDILKGEAEGTYRDLYGIDLAKAALGVTGASLQ